MCGVEGCSGEHYGKGLCEKHYRRAVLAALESEQ